MTYSSFTSSSAGGCFEPSLLPGQGGAVIRDLEGWQALREAPDQFRGTETMAKGGGARIAGRNAEEARETTRFPSR